jgi:hypothetical protein
MGISNRFFFIASAIFIAVLGVFPFLQHLPYTLELDWDYFNTLNLVVRSNILHYGRFPIHDPWMNGGLDILANPQARVLSPTLLFDLVFSPELSNLFVIMTHSILGSLGIFLIASDLSLRRSTGAFMAAAYSLGAWFSLHFAEGHIPFAAFLSIPLALFCASGLLNPRRFVALAALLSFFVLDGGIYAFVFGVIFLFTATPFLWKSFPFSPRTHAPVFIVAGFGLLCFLFAKALPILVTPIARPPFSATHPFSFEFLLKIFLDPRQSNYGLVPGTDWRFHEFGCFLGFSLLLTLLLAFSFQSGRRALRSCWPLVLVALFWLWTASGFGGLFNPFMLFQQIPFLDRLHVASRLLIFVWLILIIFFGIASDSLISYRGKRAFLLGIALIAELFFLRLRVVEEGFVRGKIRSGIRAELLQSDRIDSTVKFGAKPAHYLKGNLGARYGYEPSPPISGVFFEGQHAYRGEAWLEQGSGKIKVEEFTPGRLRVSVDADGPFRLLVNTNFLSGWKLSEGEGQVERSESGLLAWRSESAKTAATFSYSPFYLPYLIAAWLLGFIAFSIIGSLLWFNPNMRVKSQTIEI